MKTAPLVLLVLGVVVLGIFGLVAVVSFVLVATSNGRVSGEEAGPFIGGGCCCSFVGLGMAIGGLIWWLIARNSKS
jgi:hypothetical protein